MDDDPELAAIRQKRMQELMGGYGQAGGAQTPEAQEEAENKKAAAEDQRQSMLVAVLQPEARQRLARIALVKPDKARGVEDIILRMAQRGQLMEKVTEERLIGLLEQINEQAASRTKVTIQRRRTGFDDD